ncbi:MAG TPA: hypothetical protein VJC16_00655 [Candidatus Nanoarchaeia archaeon]|nr:hypothetical protein [Candidatus Nanoarchaeia archaeon]
MATADVGNLLEKVLQPFSSINVASTYQQNSVFIDFILYLVLFMGVTRFAMQKRYEPYGKMIAIVVAVMLTIGMSVAEQRYGFTIGDFSPFVLLLFFALLIFFVYSILKGLGLNSNKLSIGIALLLVYALVTGISPSFYAEMQSWTTVGSILDAVLHIGLVLGMIMSIIGVFQLWPQGP